MQWLVIRHGDDGGWFGTSRGRDVPRGATRPARCLSHVSRAGDAMRRLWWQLTLATTTTDGNRPTAGDDDDYERTRSLSTKHSTMVMMWIKLVIDGDDDRYAFFPLEVPLETNATVGDLKKAIMVEAATYRCHNEAIHSLQVYPPGTNVSVLDEVIESSVSPYLLLSSSDFPPSETMDETRPLVVTAKRCQPVSRLLVSRCWFGILLIFCEPLIACLFADTHNRFSLIVHDVIRILPHAAPPKRPDE
jgi:hypothetical protein